MPSTRTPRPRPTCRAAALALTVLAATTGFAAQSGQVRIKDIATVVGSTGQKVMGYGLVVGLEGTGDSRRSIVTQQAMANMLENFDLKVNTADLTIQNVAAVMVTATLPSSARVGDRIDVTVASMGDATSIYGGILLPTPLKANDADVYVLAQGAVSIGGFSASGGGQKTDKGHPVTGIAVNSGDVIKAVLPSLAPDQVNLSLRQPDFTTAMRIAGAINTHLGSSAARAVAAESVDVVVPEDRRGDIVTFIADIEALRVQGDTPARIVVNERTGTVIIGGDVRILPVAIAHGSLTITVSRQYDVSQPAPFTGGTALVRPGVTLGDAGSAEPPSAAPQAALQTGTEPTPQAAEAEGAPAEQAQAATARGPQDRPTGPLPGGPGGGHDRGRPEQPPSGARTVVTPRTELTVDEQPASLIEISAQTRLGDLVDALNALGVKPRDLIAILQALKTANALQAELVLM